MIVTLNGHVPNLIPRKILLDFEQAAISSFRDEFVAANISGCFFHFYKSIIRKVEGLGLKRKFETNEEIKILVKSLASLSFVPLTEINERFEELAPIFPDNSPTNDLLSYFETTYVSQRSKGRWGVSEFQIPTCNFESLY
ncbi:uncharacterized protein LOC136087001 [Hydra vulgaris]|uniref:Uncharacterized protein LOC136087001 n=1 Tax=Hydra vulgaris TaxID=6087 RepID=A0ABM4CUF3_HYDVU